MSWLSDILGFDDRDRKRAAEDRAEAERQRSLSENARLQGIYGTNSQNTLQSMLEDINRQSGVDSYNMQSARANAMGGDVSYDMNGDGTVGPGETMSVDPRQSMAGRFSTQMMANANRSGLSNSTLGLGKEAMYSKNLQDQLFGLQAGQEQAVADRKANLRSQMGALGNQAGVNYSIGADGKITSSGGATTPAPQVTPEQTPLQAAAGSLDPVTLAKMRRTGAAI